MNVIMIVMDTLRRDHVGGYGNKWIKTPNLDRFMTESAVFTRAMGESLPTIPHRRSIHTGMRTFPFEKSFYDEGRTINLSRLNLGPAAKERIPKGRQRGGYFLGEPSVVMPGWEPLPSDQITMAELLQLYGYDTAFVTDTGPYFGRPMSLVEMNFTRGFRHWDFIRGGEGDEYGAIQAGILNMDKYIPVGMKGRWEVRALDRMMQRVATWKSEDDYLAAQTWRKATEWMDGNHKSGKDFLLWVDCFEPHEPFIVPKGYADLYDTPGYDGLEPIQPKYGAIDYLTERELWRMRALYAASVTFVDKCFGKFIDRARQLGLLENTLICLTADHGFELGEHGVTGKMPQRMWKDLHDIPFIVRHPQGTGAGKRFDAFVQGQDFFPTVLDALNIPLPYEVDGKSVMPVIRGQKSKVRDYVTCGFNLNVRAVDDEYSYIATVTGDKPQLRDLKNDPFEREEIAPSNSKVTKRMFEYVMADVGHKPILADWATKGGSTDYWPLPDDASALGPRILPEKFGT